MKERVNGKIKGIINFTDFLNAEFKSTGVRASVVIPGEIVTEALDKRPIPPSPDAKATMSTAEDVGEAIAFIAGLPQRTAIPSLVVRPTLQRDNSAEFEPA